MAHGLNSMLKREIDCNNSDIKSQLPQSTLSPGDVVSNSATVAVSSSSSTSTSTSITAGVSGSAKMGSRRIFTPQFKLQVLESYRNDSDCKGNQRATARKYGIHRRQIQKWLQCESNLRSSVANLNQNNVKHQFHNISHQMPVIPSVTHTYTSHNHQQQQQYKANVLSLDTARHSVALTPMTLPSIPTAPTANVAVGATVVTTPNTIDTLAPAIITAPAAVASVVTAKAATTKCVNGSSQSQMAIPVIKSRPTSTNTTGSNIPSSGSITGVSTINISVQIQRDQQQQQQQQQQKYEVNVADNVLTHTPAIPIPLMPPHYHHHHYNQREQQHHHENHLLMPSASLPVPSSPVSVTTNRTDELRDYQPIIATGNCYMNDDYRNQQIYENLQYYSNPTYVAPIDLSLGPRRRDDDNKSDYYYGKSSDLMRSWKGIESTNDDNNNNNTHNKSEYKYEQQRYFSGASSHAVDLTCRKRKNTDNDEATTEKVQKLCKDEKSNMVSCSAPIAGKDEDQQVVKPVKLFKPYLLDEDNDFNKKPKCEQHDPIIWSHHPICITPTNYDSQSSRSSNFPASNDGYPFPSGSPTFQNRTYDGITNISSPASPPTTGTTITISSTSSPTGRTYWCPEGSPVSGYDTASTYSDSSDYYNSRSQHNHHNQFQSTTTTTYSVDFKMQTIDSYYQDMTCRVDQLAVAEKFHVEGNDVQRWLDQDTNIRQAAAAATTTN